MYSIGMVIAHVELSKYVLIHTENYSGGRVVVEPAVPARSLLLRELLRAITV